MNNDFVKQGYDKAARDYDANRNQFKSTDLLERLSQKLKKGSTMLDLGCGSGRPVDEWLVKRGYGVIGLDVSEKMIEMAKRYVPEGKYNVKDISRLKPNEYEVDAIVAFYSIFHTPREQQGELYRTLATYLQEGGLLLTVGGNGEWEGIEEFHGVKMFWSQHSPEKNHELVEKAGFKILTDEKSTTGDETHQVILAEKRKN